MSARPSWGQYWLEIAQAVSTRSTCPRAAVGAVLVTEDHQLLVAGYNGSLPGERHCIDSGVGCHIEHDHCVRTVHAEANAVAQAAKLGVCLAGSIAYVTHRPCWPCYRLLVSAGVEWIKYRDDYGPLDYTPVERCRMLKVGV